MLIDLPSEWVQTCRKIARERAQKPNSKIFTRQSSDYDIHFIGLLGEFAFAFYTGVEPDTSLINGGDRGWDFEIKGKKIQVKTRDRARYSRPDLLVRPGHATADLYVLATATTFYPSKVELVGYARHEQLVQQTVDVGYGARYFVARRDLRAIVRKAPVRL